MESSRQIQCSHRKWLMVSKPLWWTNVRRLRTIFLRHSKIFGGNSRRLVFELLYSTLLTLLTPTHGAQASIGVKSRFAQYMTEFCDANVDQVKIQQDWSILDIQELTDLRRRLICATPIFALIESVSLSYIDYEITPTVCVLTSHLDMPTILICQKKLLDTQPWSSWGS